MPTRSNCKSDRLTTPRTITPYVECEPDSETCVSRATTEESSSVPRSSPRQSSPSAGCEQKPPMSPNMTKLLLSTRPTM